MLESTQWVLIFALVSALSRAGLNVIDRYQIGLKNHSIRSVNFWNNAVPATMMTGAVMLLARHEELAALLLAWETALFAAVVQLVAYTFSYAFRRMSVNQVTVAAKLSDLFIPAGLFLSTGSWDRTTFVFAVVTTLVCLPLLIGQHRGPDKSILGVGMLMCVVLVFQASVSPLLARTADVDLQHFLLFATAVLVWRTVWSFFPLAFKSKAPGASAVNLICSPVFLLRCGLTVVTQFTFILAVSSAGAAVAWPILNTTGLFAMVLAAVILKERQAQIEKIIVILITALAAVRFVL